MEAQRKAFALLCTVYILACFHDSVFASSALSVPCNSPCLLVSKEKEIIAVDYNSATIYPIIPNLSHAYAIDYHYSLGYIFWSDWLHSIKRSNIDGTDIKVLHYTSWSSYGVAVDWRTSQLYWTDQFPNAIYVSDLDGNNNRVVLSNSSLYRPMGIVLDPERGLMFWTDYNPGRIMKSTLNSTQNVTILATSLQFPVAIDLDRQNKLVFWVDYNLKKVESVDYDGNNRKLLYQGSSYYVDGLTFFSSYLFVSNYSPHPNRTQGVFKLDSSNGAFTSYVPFPGPDTPWGLVTYDISRQLPGCASLPAPSNGTRLGCPGNTTMYYDTVCQFSCNNGYIGSGSQVRRCQQNGTWSGQEFVCQIINCTSLTQMVDPGGPLRMSSCGNHYGAKCKFSCSIGYRLNGSSTVTCVAPGNQHPGVWNNTIPTCAACTNTAGESRCLTWYNNGGCSNPTVKQWCKKTCGGCQGVIPINGGYSTWSPWTPCTMTCAGGVQQRSLSCTNPPPANEGMDCSGLGQAIKSRMCNKQNCPTCTNTAGESRCLTWYNNGGCSNPTVKQWCKKTCGGCQACTNTAGESRCLTWYNNGGCSNPTVKQWCKKTCGGCQA